jgi:hypothetical protein
MMDQIEHVGAIERPFDARTRGVADLKGGIGEP